MAETTAWRLVVAQAQEVRIHAVTPGEPLCLAFDGAVPPGSGTSVGPTPGRESGAAGARTSGARCELSLEGERLELVVPAGAGQTFLNDVQVSGRAELRPGDQLRVGGRRILVQRETIRPALPEPRIVWRRAEFEVRLRTELQRALTTNGPLALVLVQLRRTRLEPRPWDAEALPLVRAEWGRLGPDTWAALVASADAKAVTPELTRWHTAHAERGGRATFGHAVLRQPALTADELWASALDALTTHEGGHREQEEPVAVDAAVVRLRELLERVATTSAPLALIGEPGVGKSRWAWHVHQRSGMRAGPFELVDLRGAMTEPQAPSARTLRAGGTIVLKAFDSLGSDAQQQWLEAVMTLTPPTQVILTCAAPLAAPARSKVQMEVPIPALRDRRGEVLPFALQAVQQARGALQRPGLTLGPAARETLERHEWPGNVRELRNAVRLAALLTEMDEVRPENLLLNVTAGSADPAHPAHSADGSGAGADGDATQGHGDLRKALKATEKDTLLRVLARTSWNVTAAARELGLPRRTVVYRMSRLGLRRPAR